MMIGIEEKVIELLPTLILILLILTAIPVIPAILTFIVNRFVNNKEYKIDIQTIFFIMNAMCIIFFFSSMVYFDKAKDVYIKKIESRTWVTSGNGEGIKHVRINTEKAQQDKYVVFSNVKVTGYVFRISKLGWAYREVKPDMSKFQRVKYRTKKGILLENGKIVDDGIPIENEENPEVISKLKPGEYFVEDIKKIRVIK